MMKKDERVAGQQPICPIWDIVLNLGCLKKHRPEISQALLDHVDLHQEVFRDLYG